MFLAKPHLEGVVTRIRRRWARLVQVAVEEVQMLSGRQHQCTGGMGTMLTSLAEVNDADMEFWVLGVY